METLPDNSASFFVGAVNCFVIVYCLHEQLSVESNNVFVHVGETLARLFAYKYNRACLLERPLVCLDVAKLYWSTVYVLCAALTVVKVLFKFN